MYVASAFVLVALSDVLVILVGAFTEAMAVVIRVVVVRKLVVVVVCVPTVVVLLLILAQLAAQFSSMYAGFKIHSLGVSAAHLGQSSSLSFFDAQLAAQFLSIQSGFLMHSLGFVAAHVAHSLWLSVSDSAFANEQKRKAASNRRSIMPLPRIHFAHQHTSFPFPC